MFGVEFAILLSNHFIHGSQEWFSWFSWFYSRFGERGSDAVRRSFVIVSRRKRPLSRRAEPLSVNSRASLLFAEVKQTPSTPCE